MKTEMKMLNDEVKKANIIYYGLLATLAVGFGTMIALLTYGIMA